MNGYVLKHRRILGSVATLISLSVAVVYFFVTPEEADYANYLVKIILLYGHSLCWILLSLASFFWTINGKKELTIRLSYAALGVYLLFIGTLIFVKMA